MPIWPGNQADGAASEPNADNSKNQPRLGFTEATRDWRTNYWGAWFELRFEGMIAFHADVRNVFMNLELFGDLLKPEEWQETREQYDADMRALERKKLETPAPIDCREDLSRLCGQGRELLLQIARWRDKHARNTAIELEAPAYAALPPMDYSPDGFIREIWAVLHKLTGQGKPPRPDAGLTIDGAVAALESVEVWCSGRAASNAPEAQVTDDRYDTSHATTDTKDDTRKKSSKPRPYGVIEADVARLYQSRLADDPTFTLRNAVDEYTSEHGGSPKTIYRNMTDHPDKWKVASDTDATSRTTRQ